MAEVVKWDGTKDFADYTDPLGINFLTLMMQEMQATQMLNV
jgi:hypothetical protein